MGTRGQDGTEKTRLNGTGRDGTGWEGEDETGEEAALRRRGESGEEGSCWLHTGGSTKDLRERFEGDDSDVRRLVAWIV